MSGIVNQTDNVYLGGYPGPLRELAGIWVEEIDALAPEQRNQVELKNEKKGSGALLADIIHLETATAIAHYKSNFYKDTPAATINQYGEGKVYYLGTQFDKETLKEIFNELIEYSSIQKPITTELEIAHRYFEQEKLTFIINFTNVNQVLPVEFAGEVDLLSQTKLSETAVVKPYDVFIVKK